MYLNICCRGFWFEIVDSRGILLDYYFSLTENHVWVWKIHIVWCYEKPK